MQKQKKGFRSGFLLLTGGVIGAGFFALPSVVYHTGIISSISIIGIVGILITIMHLILAEVSLSLPGHRTFVGMARSLFPHWLAQATSMTNIINNFIGVLAYIILGGGFLNILFHYMHINIDIMWTITLYVVVMGYFTAISITSLNKRDGIIVTILLTTMITIIVSSLYVGHGLEAYDGNWQQHFRVYGITLFALSSINAIPLLYTTTGSSAYAVRRVILSSGFAVTILAIFFALAVISISGIYTSDNSIQGIAQVGGPLLGILGSIVGLSAIFSSHIPVLEHLKEVCIRDWNMNILMTWILIVMMPFLIYLYFDMDIIQLLGVAGSLLGGLLLIFVCMLNIYLHTSKQKVRIIPMISYDQFWSRLLILLCGTGVLYQIITLY